MQTKNLHNDNGTSKEERLKLYSALQERGRRNKLRVNLFQPHPGQKKIIECQDKSVFVFCGNGFGKTATGANLAKWYAEGFNPITNKYTKVPCTVTVILDHPSKVEEVWLKELKKWMVIDEDMLHKNGKPHINEIASKNGSRIKFMFHEQPVMVFESIEFSVVIFDEPPPREIFIAVNRGLRARSAELRLYMLGTPISQAWMHLEIYKKWVAGELESTSCFKGSLYENQANLNPEYIQNFEQLLTPEEKEVRFEGKFFDQGGFALAHLFDESTHVIKHDDFKNLWNHGAYPCVVAVDPHPSKAHVACLLGCDREGFLYYISEISQKKVARQFAHSIKEMMQTYRVVDIICDSLGSTDGSGGEGFKSFIQVLNEEGVRARATTFKDKSDESFVERIRDALLIPEKPTYFGRKLPKLRIVEGNRGIIKDIQIASWQRNKEIGSFKDRIDIEKLDFLACLKYGLASNLSYAKGKSQIYRPTSEAYGFKRGR